jgi:PadR family transcriptional regulator, regulatory protein PadR
VALAEIVEQPRWPSELCAAGGRRVRHCPFGRMLVNLCSCAGGRVRLKIGSLYGMLDRLASEGLIEPDREEAHDGRLRRYYRLTQDGRGALAEEAELRAATARVVRVRLGLAGAEAAG